MGEKRINQISILGKGGYGYRLSLGKLFDKNSSALMLALLVIFPLALDIGVSFQLGVGFDGVDPHAGENTVDAVHQDGIDPLALIFRANGDQVQVPTVVLFKRLEKVDKAKGEKFPL